MRRIRIQTAELRAKNGVVGSVIALAAWLTLGLGTTTALARPSVELKDEGMPASAVNIHIQTTTGPECMEEEHGSVATNGKPTDKLSFEAPFVHICEQAGEPPLAGTVTQATYNTAGTLKLKASPKLAVTMPGPCVYGFSKLVFQVPVGQELAPQGTQTGKLNKGSSQPGCAKTSTIGFLIQIYGSTSNRFLKGELIG